LDLQVDLHPSLNLPSLQALLAVNGKDLQVRGSLLCIEQKESAPDS
jgi:hypothetical protein